LVIVTAWAGALVFALKLSQSRSSRLAQAKAVLVELNNDVNNDSSHAQYHREENDNNRDDSHCTHAARPRRRL